ncbi:MAG: tetratricopeptide repeat protein [Geminicoccaceae bacterium]
MFEHQIREIWLEFEVPLIHGPLKRAVSVMERQDLCIASSQIDQVVKRAPNFAEGWRKRATVHFFMGDFEAAMADIERTLALEPRHFVALVKLGLICVLLDEPEAALRSFEAALEVHPQFPGLKKRVDRLRRRQARHWI